MVSIFIVNMLIVNVYVIRSLKKLTIKFKSVDQKNSAIENSRKNLEKENDDGKMFRKSYLDLTGNKIYKESNFKKRRSSGRTYSDKQIFEAMKKADQKETRKLKREWKKDKKSGNIKKRTTFKEYKRTNESPDFAEIKESFNSPT